MVELDFYNSCLLGDIVSMRKLYKYTYLRAYNDLCLRNVCASGNYLCFREVIEWCPVILSIINLKTTHKCLKNACIKGNLEIMDCIIKSQKYIDLTYNNNELLFFSVRHNHTNIVLYLLNKLNIKNISDDIVEWSIKKGNIIICENIVNRFKPKIDYRYINSVNILNIVYNYIDLDSYINYCINKDNYEMLVAINNRNVIKFSNSHLILSINKSSSKLIKFIIENGKNIDYSDENIYTFLNNIDIIKIIHSKYNISIYANKLLNNMIYTNSNVESLLKLFPNLDKTKSIAINKCYLVFVIIIILNYLKLVIELK